MKRTWLSLSAAWILMLAPGMDAPRAADASAPGHAAPLPAFGPGVTPANAAREASVRELLDAMEVRELTDLAMTQMDSIIRGSVDAALQGRRLQAREQQVLDRYMGRMVEVLREELGWDRMEPLLVEVYRRSFTQAEVESLTEFFRSPAGRAYVAKLPSVQQYSMELMQVQLQHLMPRMKQLEADMVAELSRPVAAPSSSGT